MESLPIACPRKSLNQQINILDTMHEMPDLFQIGDWWYHIISEYSDGNKMVYRMSKSLDGPWIAPADDAFDGRAYYAGRTFCLNGQRILFGWVPTKEGLR